MWVIPRLEKFQREHPDIDIRIDATDNILDLDLSDVDLAMRYGPWPPCRRRRSACSASSSPRW